MSNGTLFDCDLDARKKEKQCACADAFVEKKKNVKGNVEENATKKNLESRIRVSWISTNALVSLFTKIC